MTKGDRIRIAREEKGITQEELGRMCGTKKQTIFKYESGVITNIPLERVEKIAEILNISPCYITGWGEAPSSEFIETKKETAPPYTEEALNLAKDYDGLDGHGKRVVRLVTDEEKVRCKEEKDKREAAESHEPPKVMKMPKSRKNGKMVEIKVFDEPAAAGLGNYLDDPDFHIEQYQEHILPSGTDFGVRIDGDSMEPKIHDGYTVFVEAMPMIDPGEIGIFVLNGKSYCKKLIVDHEKRQTRLKSMNPKYEDIVIGEDDYFKTLGHVLGQWGPGSREDDFLDWIEK